MTYNVDDKIILMYYSSWDKLYIYQLVEGDICMYAVGWMHLGQVSGGGGNLGLILVRVCGPLF